MAAHERAAGKYAEVLTLDHYLEVLKYKPGALPGATALAQARAAGAFTASHQRYWDAARRARGDAAGTRALTEVLLGHRTLPAAALTEAMDRAVGLRCAGPAGRADRRPPPGRRPGRAGHPDRRAGPLRPARARPGRLRPAADREHPVTGVSDTAALAAIGAAARELKLPTVRADAARLAEIAVRERQTHLGYLAEILSAEIDDRTGRRRTRRIAEARFPRIKRLADFNPDAIPGIAATLAALAAGAWIDAGEPVVAARGLRHRQDPPADRPRAWPPASRAAGSATPPPPQLVNELAEAADQRQLSRVVGRYGRLDLLLLDELGYVQLDPRGAELLFQIITEREERASIAIGTNLPFSEWGTVFPDPRLVAAIVDRVTFNAHILETGTQSYRLATSTAAALQKASYGGRRFAPFSDHAPQAPVAQRIERLITDQEAGGSSPSGSTRDGTAPAAVPPARLAQSAERRCPHAVGSGVRVPDCALRTNRKAEEPGCEPSRSRVRVPVVLPASLAELAEGSPARKAGIATASEVRIPSPATGTAHGMETSPAVCSGESPYQSLLAPRSRRWTERDRFRSSRGRRFESCREHRGLVTEWLGTACKAVCALGDAGSNPAEASNGP